MTITRHDCHKTFAGNWKKAEHGQKLMEQTTPIITSLNNRPGNLLDMIYFNSLLGRQYSDIPLQCGQLCSRFQ